MLKKTLQQTDDIVAQTIPESQWGIMFKRSGLYNGSSADCERPSLHAIGMGERSVKSGSTPYYDQRVVAKIKEDSQAPSQHGHLQLRESSFDAVYDNRFRPLRQGDARLKHGDAPTPAQPRTPLNVVFATKAGVFQKTDIERIV